MHDAVPIYGIAQRSALLHQEGFVLSEADGPVGLVGPAEQVDVVQGELASIHRGGGSWQRQQLAGSTQLDPGTGARAGGVA